MRRLSRVTSAYAKCTLNTEKYYTHGEELPSDERDDTSI